MTLDNLKKINKNIDKLSEEILCKKNNDYSKDNDALDNFKKQAAICGILNIDDSPKSQALRAVVLKIIRLCNLVYNNKEPNYESIDDTEIDLINYIKLFKFLRIEEYEDNETKQLYFLNELLEDTNKIIKYTNMFLKDNNKNKKVKTDLLALKKYYIRARMSIKDRIKKYKG